MYHREGALDTPTLPSGPQDTSDLALRLAAADDSPNDPLRGIQGTGDEERRERSTRPTGKGETRHRVGFVRHDRRSSSSVQWGTWRL